MDASYCPQSLVFAEKTTNSIIQQENGRDYKSVNIEYEKTVGNISSLITTTAIMPSSTMTTTTTTTTTTAITTTTTTSGPPPLNPRATTASPMAEYYKANPYDINVRNKNLEHHPSNNYYRDHTDQWITKSGCHFSCIDMSKGIQLVSSRRDYSSNIQLCSPEAVVIPNHSNIMKKILHF